MIPGSLAFVGIAVVLPTVGLGVWAVRRRPHRGLGRHLAGIVVLSVAALLYTAPWDALLLARGVRQYGDGVLHGRLWGAPLGRFVAVAVQPWLAGLWLYHVDYADPIPDVPLRTRAPMRLAGVAAAAAVGAAGVAIATPLDGPGLYLGSALVWAMPALALEWTVGWRFLWRQRSVLLSAVAVPTVYLWLVDWLAIRRGHLTVERHLGTGVAGLPVETMTVTFIAVLLAVQGLMLWYWAIDRRKRRTA